MFVFAFALVMLVFFVLMLIEILVLNWTTGVVVTAFAMLVATCGFIVAIKTASKMRIERAFDELLDE
jgi:hypothetical protein